ncbi:unnamed protein product, partial [Polarella glacialis]
QETQDEVPQKANPLPLLGGKGISEDCTGHVYSTLRVLAKELQRQEHPPPQVRLLQSRWLSNASAQGKAMPRLSSKLQVMKQVQQQQPRIRGSSSGLRLEMAWFSEH